MKTSTIFPILVGAILTAGWVTPALAKEQPAGKSIVQMMREHGFKHKTASWTSVSVSVDESKKSTTSEGKFWLSGDKYRMESKDSQGKKMIMIDDGKDLYMIDMSEKKAFTGEAMKTMFGSVMASDMVAESARQRKTAKKLGSEVVEGKPCQIYQYSMNLKVMGNETTSDVKEWVWTAENFPVKSIVKTPRHKMKVAFMTMDVPASETTNTVKDLVLDQPVDEGMFKVPAGVKVEQMDEMPGMPGAAAGRGAPANSEDSGEAGEDAGQPPAAVQELLKGLF